MLSFINCNLSSNGKWTKNSLSCFIFNETGGYKGYGLSAMVEILCGVLAGAHYGPHIRKWKTTNSVADLVRKTLLQTFFFGWETENLNYPKKKNRVK